MEPANLRQEDACVVYAESLCLSLLDRKLTLEPGSWINEVLDIRHYPQMFDIST